jgi:hypothetical protein
MTDDGVAALAAVDAIVRDERDDTMAGDPCAKAGNLFVALNAVTGVRYDLLAKSQSAMNISHLRDAEEV